MIQKAYDSWANSYDNMVNKTRDLDKKAVRQSIAKLDYKTVLELGCGTGKNTAFFMQKADSVIGLDFSEEMLGIAKKKIASENVKFQYADLTKKWQVKNCSIDLISCSLTLEHIFDLDFIFQQGFEKLKSKGNFFISELHPFKQYTGSKAKFKTQDGVEEVEVFTHHISDFLIAANNNGFKLIKLEEWFDNPSKKDTIPRLVTFLFEKSN